MSGKRKSLSKRVPGGYSQIADRKNGPAYERQRNFVYGWFFEMLEKLKSNDAKSAHSAIEALEGLFLAFTSTLLGLAKAGKDKTTKQWAGRLLASVGCSICKYDEKLCAANRSYREEKAKIGELRLDVLFPRKISRIVQRELKKAERMQRRLLVIKKVCGGQWRKTATRQRIPKAYWRTMQLDGFSGKSEPQWWKFLWPLIKKKIDVSKMSPLKQREYETYRVSHNVRTGRTEASPGNKKNRKRYHSDLQKSCRDHFKTLARLRDSGTLY